MQAKAGAWGDDNPGGYSAPGPASGSAYDVGGVMPGDEDRLASIMRREQAALALQRDLDEREERLTARATHKGMRLPKNWPPYLQIARNAIGRDIPEEFQWDVRKFYSLWILTVIGTVFNFFIAFWYGTSPDGGDDSDLGVTQWFLVLGYMFIGLPSSWMLWYKKFYNAMRTNDRVPTMFFVCLMLHIAWSMMMAAGLVMLGGFGILFMGKMYTNKHNALGTCAVLNGALWILNAVLGLLLLRVGHRSLGRFYAQEYLVEKAKTQAISVPDSEPVDDDVYGTSTHMYA